VGSVPTRKYSRRATGHPERASAPVSGSMSSSRISGGGKKLPRTLPPVERLEPGWDAVPREFERLAWDGEPADGVRPKFGTLQPGKNADLVIWSGDPFSVYTRADQVFIDGALIYDRSRSDVQPTTDFELGILPSSGQGGDR